MSSQSATFHIGDGVQFRFGGPVLMIVGASDSSGGREPDTFRLLWYDGPRVGLLDDIPAEVLVPFHTTFAEPFQPGDRVRFHVGGPSMMVNDVGRDRFGQSDVECNWFENGRLFAYRYPPDMLTLDRLEPVPADADGLCTFAFHPAYLELVQSADGDGSIKASGNDAS